MNSKKNTQRSTVITWLLALRPWSFPMSAISVTIGTLWAGVGNISWVLYCVTILGMIAIHAASNMVNDYFDVKNDVDTPCSPTSRYRPHPILFGELSQRFILFSILSLYAIGLAAGLYLVVSRGWPVLWIGAAGAAIGLAYTGGPLALKYHALGEPAVFLIWGPLAIQGAYYVQTQVFSVPLLLVSVPFGMLVSLVLLANNIRDAAWEAEGDYRTLAIMLGLKRSKAVYVMLVCLAFLSVALMSILGPLGPWSLLVILALPLAVSLCRMINREIALDIDARTARLDLVFGLLFIVSILIDWLVT